MARFGDVRLRFLHDTARVLDVGANEGQYTRRLRADGYTGEVVSFEPGRAAYRKLERAASVDSMWRPVHAAVTDRLGSATLNISANSYSSSLLQITGAHTMAAPEAAYVGSETVQTTTLDAVEIPRGPIYLKMDVQGTEPLVLAGAKRVLEDVIAIELELSLIPLYKEQELAPAVCDRLRRLGFVPVAFQTAFADPDTMEILALDGLFARRPAAPAP